MTLHEIIANSHPSLKRGQVWCRNCRSTQNVVAADTLRFGWPKCCGHTMTIDHPDAWDSDNSLGEAGK